MIRVNELVGDFLKGDKSRSKWRQFLSVSVFIGVVVILLRSGVRDPAAISAPAILGGSSLFVGILIGFLFGIPKTVHRKLDAANTPSLSEGDYQPNTNLEEISDWLTKMLVGIGLVQLRELPRFVDHIAGYWELSVAGPYPRAYAAGLLVYFSTIGFLIGYLWTRLALVGDFIEKDPRRLISQILSQVARSAQNNPEATERSPDRQVVTVQELDAARTLAALTSESGINLDELRRQIRRLATEYEAVRASMRPSSERTRKMEVIASQMRTFSIAGYPLLSEFTQSNSSGERLAAITFLQTRPNYVYLNWLAERVAVEKPFIGYHATVALLHAAQAAAPEQRDLVRSAAERALSSVSHLSDATDRVGVLKRVLSVLQPAAVA